MSRAELSTSRSLRVSARALMVGLMVGLVLVSVMAAPSAQAVRLKDIAFVDGVRPNQLIGYGLVVGLDGTGDNQRVSFTTQSLTAMLSRAGIRVDPDRLNLQNIAAVMVTATLPSSAQAGSAIDVLVSAIGTARSLEGGTLLLTPLKGVDRQVYGMAQGALQVGATGQVGTNGTRRRVIHKNVGRVPGGGLVERVVPVSLGDGQTLLIRLRRPDFTTAKGIADELNKAAGSLGSPGVQIARAAGAGTVEVTIPAARRTSVAAFIAGLEAIQVTPDAVARVVLNGRTGTVVMGRNVQIESTAVAHGGLSVEVRGGRDGAAQQAGITAVGGGANLAAVVRALNALGATPDDLVTILQAMRAAGALHAEIEVQ